MNHSVQLIKVPLTSGTYNSVIMAACVADAVIVFIRLLFFFAYSQRSEINGCLPCFRTRCGLSANLECRSEM